MIHLEGVVIFYFYFFGEGVHFFQIISNIFIFFFTHFYLFKFYFDFVVVCVRASGREGDEMGLVFKRAKVVSLSYIIINFKAKMRMTDRRSCKRVQIQIKSLKYCQIYYFVCYHANLSSLKIGLHSNSSLMLHDYITLKFELVLAYKIAKLRCNVF